MGEFSDKRMDRLRTISREYPVYGSVLSKNKRSSMLSPEAREGRALALYAAFLSENLFYAEPSFDNLRIISEIIIDTQYKFHELTNDNEDDEVRSEVLEIINNIKEYEKIFRPKDGQNKGTKTPFDEIVFGYRIETAIRYFETEKILDPFEKLDEFSRKNPGQPVSGLVKKLLPELIDHSSKVGVNPIPVQAPERWTDRKAEDITPAHFIDRVYGQWIGRGFHTGHIRSLDGGLETAYGKWIKNGSPGAPQGFHLPTKHEAMQAEPAPVPDTIEARRHADRIRQRAFRNKQGDRAR